MSLFVGKVDSHCSVVRTMNVFLCEREKERDMLPQTKLTL